jgi:hypothetical protein
MSKIAFSPNASGTGTFTVAAPNTNTDYTLTLPQSTGILLNDQSDIETQVKTATNATGSAPIYTYRAWVNFDGTGTPAIREDGNVSSITDNGTGDYTVNFATAMPDANYATCANAGPTSAAGNYSLATYTFGGTYSTSEVQISTYRQASGTPTLTDYAIVSVSIFR